MMKSEGQLVEFGFERMGGTFNENTVVLTHLLGTSEILDAINQTTLTSSIGVDMTLDAMRMLTAHTVKIDGLSVSSLNKNQRDYGVSANCRNPARVVNLLSEHYNVEWLEAYVRMASMRLTFGKANHRDKLLVAGINTCIMKGQIAISIVVMLGIFIKPWAIECPAALYELSRNLPQADDLLPDEFENTKTIREFLEALTQEGVRFALTHNCDEMHSLYLYLAGGDEDTADHNIKMLKKAYGIADEPDDDTEESPDPSKVDISRLDVLFGGDLPAR